MLEKLLDNLAGTVTADEEHDDDYDQTSSEGAGQNLTTVDLIGTATLIIVLEDGNWFQGPEEEPGQKGNEEEPENQLTIIVTSTMLNSG